MKQAMLGIVLEKDDWDCLEAVKDGRELDTGGIVWKCLRKVGAVVQIPSLKKNWPFLCLKPRLTFIGEDMLYECQRAPKEELWFIGSDILGGGIWENFRNRLGI